MKVRPAHLDQLLGELPLANVTLVAVRKGRMDVGRHVRPHRQAALQSLVSRRTLSTVDASRRGNWPHANAAACPGNPTRPSPVWLYVVRLTEVCS